MNAAHMEYAKISSSLIERKIKKREKKENEIFNQMKSLFDTKREKFNRSHRIHNIDFLQFEMLPFEFHYQLLCDIKTQFQLCIYYQTIESYEML